MKRRQHYSEVVTHMIKHEGMVPSSCNRQRQLPLGNRAHRPTAYVQKITPCIGAQHNHKKVSWKLKLWWWSKLE